MKKEFVKQSTETVEFGIPCYVRFGENRFYKIISETKVVAVSTYGFSTLIEVVSLDHCNPFGNDGWVFITREEYLQAEEIALQTITHNTGVNKKELLPEYLS